MKEATDSPIFINSVTGKEFTIPKTVRIDDSSEELTFSRQKTAGLCPGGWYKNATGNEFIVKFDDLNSYLEKLLNKLAAISVGTEFVAQEILTGSGNFNGATTPCFIAGQVPGYKDLQAIENLDERKSYAPQLHQAYSFLAMFAFDDCNEGNIGIDKSSKIKIIDFGYNPSFLYPEQIESAHVPFHLASFIGHRNANGMQLTRNRYFGYDGFLNPLERKNWESLTAPQEISYYSVLAGMKQIIDKKSDVNEAISATIEEVKARPMPEKQRSGFMSQLNQFQSAILSRIDYAKKAFAPDLENLETKKQQFSKMKW